MWFDLNIFFLWSKSTRKKCKENSITSEYFKFLKILFLIWWLLFQVIKQDSIKMRKILYCLIRLWMVTGWLNFHCTYLYIIHGIDNDRFFTSLHRKNHIAYFYIQFFHSIPGYINKYTFSKCHYCTYMNQKLLYKRKLLGTKEQFSKVLLSYCEIILKLLLHNDSLFNSTFNA